MRLACYGPCQGSETRWLKHLASDQPTLLRPQCDLEQVTPLTKTRTGHTAPPTPKSSRHTSLPQAPAWALRAALCPRVKPPLAQVSGTPSEQGGGCRGSRLHSTALRFSMPTAQTDGPGTGCGHGSAAAPIRHVGGDRPGHCSPPSQLAQVGLHPQTLHSS